MATTCVCDKCGAKGAGRVTVDWARSQPLVTNGDPPHKFDKDLCQKCFDELLRSLAVAFAIPS